MNRIFYIRMIQILSVFFILSMFHCASNEQYNLESIHAPINLTITNAGGYYRASFYSDNTEDGFTGYGLFQGASATAAAGSDTDADNDNLVSDYSATTNAAFCSMAVSSLDYSNAIVIQIGGATADSDARCHLSTTELSLSSGNYIAIRARVEREEKPWSQAATALIP